MSELSERAAALTEELEKCCVIRWTDTPFAGDQEYAGLSLAATRVIEQALLAERRLAMEEAARIIETSPVYCQSLAEMLRAAAEKEVGK